MDFKLGQQVYYSVSAIKEQPTECWEGMLEAKPLIVGMHYEDYEKDNPVNITINDEREFGVCDGWKEDDFSEYPTFAEML